MKTTLRITFFVFIAFFPSLLSTLSAQNTLYFPPLTGSEWQTVSPKDLGWCDEYVPQLYDYLGKNNTKAFIVLHDGKIVLEHYFGSFTQDSLWYWASAGKSLTAFLVGFAKQYGQLQLDDRVSFYLGNQWSSLTYEQEQKITIRNQLTMTTGFDDNVPDPYCTLQECLIYKADPGTRWAYHNAPYTLLDRVIESATGETLNDWFNQTVAWKTGMKGRFVKSGYNNLFISNARTFARFGLLIQNKGVWNNIVLMTDQPFFNEMVNSSQLINPAYGYLWWLNGKDRFMLPQTQMVFNGFLMPSAPADLIAAMGKNGQFLNIVPSRGLVLVRMGNSPDGNEVPMTMNDSIWQYMNKVLCIASVNEIDRADIKVFPNPVVDKLTVSFPSSANLFDLSLFDLNGSLLRACSGCNEMNNLNNLPSGFYLLRVRYSDNVRYFKVQKL